MDDKKMNNMEINIPHPNKKMMELLDKQRRGELTSKQVLEECAYWGLQGLDFCRFRNYPAKPKEVIEYLEKKSTTQDFKIADKFWQEPSVRSYIAMWLKVESLNRGNFFWLNEMLSNLPQGDTVSRDKIKDCLRGFILWQQNRQKLQEQENPAEENVVFEFEGEYYE